MKYPTTEEIILEAKDLKIIMKAFDFQMGLSKRKERTLFRKINRILRMLKCPVRRVKIEA